MDFYVIHYTPLLNRKDHIVNEFEKHQIDKYFFMELHDRECLTNEQLDKFNKPTFSEISLFYKHIEVIEKQQNSSGITCIFEDDAVLVDGFLEKIKKCLEELPEDWDLVFGGACVNLHCEVLNDKYTHAANSSRGTCFYMMNNKCASKIINCFSNCGKISLPIDHWFNYAINNCSLKTFWTEPTLVNQGSESGYFSKTIDIS